MIKMELEKGRKSKKEALMKFCREKIIRQDVLARSLQTAFILMHLNARNVKEKMLKKTRPSSFDPSDALKRDSSAERPQENQIQRPRRQNSLDRKMFGGPVKKLERTSELEIEKTREEKIQMTTETKGERKEAKEVKIQKEKADEISKKIKRMKARLFFLNRALNSSLGSKKEKTEMDNGEIMEMVNMNLHEGHYSMRMHCRDAVQAEIIKSLTTKGFGKGMTHILPAAGSNLLNLDDYESVLNSSNNSQFGSTSNRFFGDSSPAFGFSRNQNSLTRIPGDETQKNSMRNAMETFSSMTPKCFVLSLESRNNKKEKRMGEIRESVENEKKQAEPVSFGDSSRKLIGENQKKKEEALGKGNKGVCAKRKKTILESVLFQGSIMRKHEEDFKKERPFHEGKTENYRTHEEPITQNPSIVRRRASTLREKPVWCKEKPKNGFVISAKMSPSSKKLKGDAKSPRPKEQKDLALSQNRNGSVPNSPWTRSLVLRSESLNGKSKIPLHLSQMNSDIISNGPEKERGSFKIMKITRTESHQVSNGQSPQFKQKETNKTKLKLHRKAASGFNGVFGLKDMMRMSQFNGSPSAFRVRRGSVL